jgi:hypothetical protein
MVRRNHNLGLVRVAHKIHGTTHAFEDFTRDHEVGEITVCTDLESLKCVSEEESMGSGRTYTKDRNIDVPATNHGK